MSDKNDVGLQLSEKTRFMLLALLSFFCKNNSAQATNLKKDLSFIIASDKANPTLDPVLVEALVELHSATSSLLDPQPPLPADAQSPAGRPAWLRAVIDGGKG